MRYVRALSTVVVAVGVIVTMAPVGCSSKQDSFGAVTKPAVDAGRDVTVLPPTFELDGGSTVDDSGGNLQDALPEIDAKECTPEDAGPGPIPRACMAATVNECDGQHDVPGAVNGEGGNGFDDDCDGLVDEGCACASAGVTKECYLVPASQVNSLTRKPVGWCEANSKGTMECQGGERRVWSGECRGARPPFADDACSKGDFDCDGKDLNSRNQDCACKGDLVTCPTAPVETVPYPTPSALPLKIDGSTWLVSPGLLPQVTAWKWTLRGGDCDNILPHPTFSLYASADGSGNPISRTVGTLGASGKERGTVASSPQISGVVYPAFSLSGDYFLEGELTLQGKTYSCLQKIQVRAPGIRAEACWDTEPLDVDLDLHMAKTDGFSTCPNKGWSDVCPGQDCYYANCTSSALSGHPPWGYSVSPNASACVGWGSMATGTCRNPRLDRDANGVSGSCNGSTSNPNNTGSSGFCGPENINVDAPAIGSKYAVSLKYYSGSAPSKAHVNVYCNGERVLSAGYNPVTGNEFPVLREAGGNQGGDMWKVALVTITQPDAGGAGIACNVEPVPSQTPHPTTDGSGAYCVDNQVRNGTDSTRFFTNGGFAPGDPRAMCFH